MAASEEQQRERRLLADFKRNLSPELYDALIRLRRARAKAVRNFYNERVEVESNDLIALLAEFERIYSTELHPSDRAVVRGKS